MSRINESFRFFSIIQGASVTDEDDSGDPEYFGFTRPGGSWVIMKHIIATGKYTFYIGKDLDNTLTNYDVAFADRANLQYRQAGLLPEL